MKRNNSQSVKRKVKRGHIRFAESKFVFNENGTPKLLMQRRTKRGYWVNSSI